MSDSLIFSFEKRTQNQKEVIDLNQLQGNEVILSFHENESCEVSLSSLSYSVEIECPAFYSKNGKDKSVIFTKDGILFLKNNDTFVISHSGDEEVGYDFGIHYLNVVNLFTKKTIRVFFHVLHLYSVSDDGLKDMKESLEAFLSGITLDKKGRKKPHTNKDELSDNLQSQLSFIEKKEKELNGIIYALTCNLQYRFLSVYKEMAGVRKQNAHSLKLNLTKPLTTGVFYNAKKQITYDTEENRLLKNYLEKISKIISSLSSFVSSIQDRYLETSRNLNTRKDQILFRQAHSNNSYIKRSCLALSLDISAQAEELNKRETNLQGFESSLDQSLLAIKRLLNSDNLIPVSDCSYCLLTPEYSKDYNYVFFKKYNEFLKSKEGEKNTPSPMASKRTMSLFEYYGIVLLNEVLEELGFRLSKTDVVNSYDFLPDTFFAYENKDQTAIIRYNHHCQHYFTQIDPGIVNINSKNDLPDYLIEFYQKSNQAFLGGLVVEMKYRSLTHIYSETEPLDAEATLSDYVQLGYKDEQGFVHRNAIKAGYILYPDEKEETHYTLLGDIYQGINLEKKKDTLAVKEIKETIQKKILPSTAKE